MIKLGKDHFGAELWAETDSIDGFWIEIKSPYSTNIGICVRGRSNLEALAELVAEALAALTALPEGEATP